ncbi:hypothetical protein GCM10009733_071380 [Nonomuraea maheshkhaliensis]|uniref:Uncharacterized protein n=1 Tax=Nonomuraea maheshkhaliensis TaxID=419590 RepID=A0ABN2G0Y3_9ACTN
MSTLIDRALALVLPEVKAAAVCGYQYQCRAAGWSRRLCCSSSADNCSPWQVLSPACP